MNSRHPDPRRVRTGGPEQQSADGIRWIRGIRGIRWIRRWVLFFQFSIVKIGTLCFLPSPLCGEMGGRGLKHCKTQYFWHLDFRRGFPGAQEAQAASQLLPVWVHYLGSMLPLGVCSTTLGSMFNYPGEYVQLPWGVFSTTFGSMFNYPA